MSSTCDETSFPDVRIFKVKFSVVFAFLLGVIGLLAAGCGGSGTNAFGDVTGVVFDTSGNPVRGAHVYYSSLTNSVVRNTYSSTSGSYLISQVPAESVIIRGEAFQGATRFYGQNVTTVLQGDRVRNVNLYLVPDSEVGAITGTVFDRSGNVIQDAHIFAIPSSGPQVSSGLTVSASDGSYSVGGLQQGQTYTVVCNALGYGTDSTTITLNSATANAVFTLDVPTNPSIPAPTNVSAESWTTPAVGTTRSMREGQALDAIRAIDNGRRGLPVPKLKISRDTVNGNPIECDLFWSPVAYTDLLGFGIYRGPDPNSLVSVDFLRDPLATFFADADATLTEGQTYYFAMTSINTSYTGPGVGESALSQVVSVETLGDVTLEPVTNSPLTFSWLPTTGATQYAVYIFDQYPSIGVTSVFDNYSSPVTGTQFVYNGPALQSGATYYYMVQAMTSDLTGNSLSEVQSFVAP